MIYKFLHTQKEFLLESLILLCNIIVGIVIWSPLDNCHGVTHNTLFVCLRVQRWPLRSNKNLCKRWWQFRFNRWQGPCLYLLGLSDGSCSKGIWCIQNSTFLSLDIGKGLTSLDETMRTKNIKGRGTHPFWCLWYIIGSYNQMFFLCLSITSKITQLSFGIWVENRSTKYGGFFHHVPKNNVTTVLV